MHLSAATLEAADAGLERSLACPKWLCSSSDKQPQLKLHLSHPSADDSAFTSLVAPL